MIFFNLFLFYLAFLLSIYLHELGHFGKTIKLTIFPFPVGVATAGRFRIGGLIVNIGIAFLIYLWKPENIFIQLIGLANFLHFNLYAIIGSFNQDKGYVNGVKGPVFDDVKNESKWKWLSIAFISLLFMGQYYFTIFKSIWQ